ncbi:hypothetical protein CL622_08420 [archaeon]|nr:hypothetical protein [archaeon]|tara:strand:+ start:1112 stop:2050 length:939 start_codon:yes stop_codon:yes gene_type:complete
MENQVISHILEGNFKSARDLLQGTIRFNLPVISWDSIYQEIISLRASLNYYKNVSTDWHYNPIEQKEAKEKAKEYSNELQRVWQSYDSDKHENAKKEAAPFRRFLDTLDGGLISRMVSGEDSRGIKTNDFDAIVERECDGKIRYCYIDRRKKQYLRNFMIFSSDLGERMMLKNIDISFEELLLQAHDDLMNKKIRHDFGYVFDNDSKVIGHPNLITKGQMRSEETTNSASYGAIIQALHLRVKFERNEWDYDPRINYLLCRFNVTDGGGLLLVFDRKEQGKYVFRPLSIEEYKGYAKHYIYQEGNDVFLQTL